MKHRLMISIVAVVTIFAASPTLRPQTAQQPAAGVKPAETVPDLTGTWNFDDGPHKDVGVGRAERPYVFFTREPVQMLPWAAKRYAAARKGMADDRPDFGRADQDPAQYPYCMPFGFPRAYSYSDAFEIMQSPGKVYIVFESSQVQRIYTDGRGFPKGPPLTFMGQSIGRWESDTLVVETKDINELTWIDSAGHPHSDALRVEQRFRRLNQNQMEVKFLFDDPKTYKKPWGGTRIYKLRVSKDPSKDYIEDTYVCQDHVTDDFSEKVLGNKPRQDDYRLERNEGKGY